MNIQSPAAPAVSIVVPVYNAKRFVAETVQSVLDQSYRDFELILVDDGSSDGTADVLAGFSDRRVQVHRQLNAGISAARNSGVARSRGRYVAFLDHDDVWLPDKLDRQVRLLEENPELGLVYADTWVVDDAGRPGGTFSDRMTMPSGRVFRSLLARNFIPTSSVVMPRRVFDEVGPFQPFRISQDYDLWLKCAFRYPVARAEEPLLKYRRLSAGASRRVIVPLEECLEIYAYWSDRLDPADRPLLRRCASELCYLSGKTVLYDNGDAALGRRLFRDALRRRIGAGPALFYLLTFLPPAWTLRARAVVKPIMTRSKRPAMADPAARAAPPPGVLMVIASYPPEIAGGGALQCHTLVRALQDRVAFQVLSVTRPNTLAERDVVDGVPVRRIKLDPSSRPAQLAAAWRLVRFFAAHRREFSIVHCHSFTAKTLLVVALSKLFDKPVLMKFTSYGFDDPVTLMQGRLGRLRLAALRRIDRFVGVSPAFADSFRRAGMPVDRLVEVPNGVDTLRFAPAASREAQCALRRSLGLPQDQPIVTSIGHFSPEKGIVELVDAWLSLRSAGGRSHLVLIGSMSSSMYEVDPALVEQVRRRVREAEAGASITFVEQTRQVADYLRASDVFVLASHREGLPNALLEAMATALPCIVSRLPGVTDRLIADDANGLLVPPGDVEALAAALGRLLGAPALRQALGARARETIAGGYSIDEVARRYLSLYRGFAV